MRGHAAPPQLGGACRAGVSERVGMCVLLALGFPREMGEGARGSLGESRAWALAELDPGCRPHSPALLCFWAQLTHLSGGALGSLVLQASELRDSLKSMPCWACRGAVLESVSTFKRLIGLSVSFLSEQMDVWPFGGSLCTPGGLALQAFVCGHWLPLQPGDHPCPGPSACCQVSARHVPPAAGAPGGWATCLNKPLFSVFCQLEALQGRSGLERH